MSASYKWYYVMNTSDLRTSDLGSRTYTLVLDGIGQKDILVTLGSLLGITYDGIFLTVNLNEKNPFKFDSHAIYIDELNQVWLGFIE